MNWLLIILAFILLWRVVEGFKRGMVKEIISFISLIVLCVVVILIGSALGSYLEKDMVSMAVAVILLIVLCIAHRILSFFLFSAKLVSKLPVIHSMDKLLGVIFGLAETVMLIWTAYILLMTFDTGAIGQQVLAYVQENRVLTFLYEYNYLAKWVGMLSDKIATLPLKVI